MAADKKYKHRTSITLCSEADLIKEFKELCWRERKTFSEKLTEFMVKELEKNALGTDNPIKISYGETNKDNHKDCWKQLTLYEATPKNEIIQNLKQCTKEQLNEVEAFNTTLTSAINFIKINPSLLQN